MKNKIMAGFLLVAWFFCALYSMGVGLCYCSECKKK